MRKTVLLLLLLWCFFLNAQVKICSWNLCDMGQSKNEEGIQHMADILKTFDVVALQEIVAGPEGSKAVAKLVDALDRTGNEWSYIISAATKGNRQKRERYAFLWKPSKVMLKGKPWLDSHFAAEVEREPYFATFYYNGKEFTLVNYHAITKRMQPETEIKYFKFYPEKYPNLNLIFAGDFNCPQSHSVFGPLKRQGYSPVLLNVKTTLKKECKQECTASEFDNFFYHTHKATISDYGIVGYYKTVPTLQRAREISDHIPIWMVLVLK